jgi:hypothetical protein
MRKHLIASLAAATVATPLWAEPAQHIDVSTLPAQAKVIDTVVVPVPSEVFNVLDKLGKPNWEDVLRPMKEGVKTPGEAPHTALLLGTVIAEGFIAVEAENGEEVKKIGGSVRRLATALGVGKRVDERANAIIKGANAKNWAVVRQELDKAMEDVKSAMSDLNSEPLSQLISIGGWLRGTEALTEVVGKSFSKDGAELLHQPLLLDYFERKLSAMPPKYKQTSLITDVQKGVLDIRPLVGFESGDNISEKSVKEVGGITGRLIESIQPKK